jgi:hypothetical protein
MAVVRQQNFPELVGDFKLIVRIHGSFGSVESQTLRLSFFAFESGLRNGTKEQVSEGTVDEYNSSLQLIIQSSGWHAPAGYAPFNVQNVAGNVFVTYCGSATGLYFYAAPMSKRMVLSSSTLI